MCWDCGKSYKDKNDLMIHRKNVHDVPTCSKFKTQVGCDKLDDDCWYPHKYTRTTAQSKTEQSVTYANIVSQSNGAQQATLQNTRKNEPKQDFPEVTQNKSVPLKGKEEPPTKTETILMEMMNL